MRLAHAVRYARFFGFALVATLATLIAVQWIAGFHAVLLALILIVLETTFSFDNAVVNAGVVRRMSVFWQRIFLSIGIVIAVFGMRLVFPLALVSVASNMSLVDVYTLALQHPIQYSEHLEAAMPAISMFGGIFLFLVCLSFFFENRGRALVPMVESMIHTLPQHAGTLPSLALLLVCALALLSAHDFVPLFVAGALGITLFTSLRTLIHRMVAAQLAAKTAYLTGIAGFTAFLYLEILDASFSLDSAIGAFAITSSVLLISAGLGVGAIWVRSLTIYLVRHDTLVRYVFLQHGAHYAIGLLSLALLASLFVHVPEALTGLAGICMIGYSVMRSRTAT